MSKKWFIKEGEQVCFKSDNAELNGWDIQSLVDCLNGKEIKITELEAKLAESEKEFEKYRKDAIESYNSFTNERFNLKSENVQLKQQLFESGLKTLEEIKLSEQRKKMLEDLSTKNWKLEQ